jgi:hypothetical protein
MKITRAPQQAEHHEHPALGGTPTADLAGVIGQRTHVAGELAREKVLRVLTRHLDHSELREIADGRLLQSGARFYLGISEVGDDSVH